MKNLKIEDEVHKRLALFRAAHDFKTFGLAVTGLLDFFEEAEHPEHMRAPGVFPRPPEPEDNLVEDPPDEDPIARLQRLTLGPNYGEKK